jgi:hypothetical protein
MPDKTAENPAPKPKIKPRHIWIDEYALHEDQKFQQLMRDVARRRGPSRLTDIEFKRRQIRDSDD